MKKVATIAAIGFTTLIGLTACGSDNESAQESSPTTLAPITTAAPTTTEEPTSTAAPTTTEAPTTLAPTTTAAPTTTEAPTTTAAPPTTQGLTPAQRNAVRAAESYLKFRGFSRQGLIDQLSSEYGDQFPVEDATAAVDSLNVNWNEQAVKAAQSYLDMRGFSCQGLIDQLSSEYGDQFTEEEATYGATGAGAC